MPCILLFVCFVLMLVVFNMPNIADARPNLRLMSFVHCPSSVISPPKQRDCRPTRTLQLAPTPHRPISLSVLYDVLQLSLICLGFCTFICTLYSPNLLLL